MSADSRSSMWSSYGCRWLAVQSVDYGLHRRRRSPHPGEILIITVYGLYFKPRIPQSLCARFLRQSVHLTTNQQLRTKTRKLLQRMELRTQKENETHNRSQSREQNRLDLGRTTTEPLRDSMLRDCETGLPCQAPDEEP